MTNDTPDDAPTVLVRKIDAVLGDATATRTILRAALITARRAELPSDPHALMAFVRGYVVDALVEEIGIRAVADLLAELDATFATTPTTSRPPAPLSLRSEPAHSDMHQRPRVLLFDPDRLARSALARALLARGCDVTSIDDASDLEDRAFYIAIVNMDLPGADRVLAALRRANPLTRVIARTSGPPPTADEVLRAAGVGTYQVVPSTAADSELHQLVRRLFTR